MGVSPTTAIILAAGEGKRLRSHVPKVLHVAAGRPLLVHVLTALAPMGFDERLVVTAPGTEIEPVVTAAGFDGIKYAVQHPPRGTGDAVRVALQEVETAGGDVLVICGDTPLLKTETLRNLVAAHKDRGAVATMLIARTDSPAGEGRIIRGEDGDVDHIVEERDATPAELAVDEINAGVYVFDEPALRELVGELRADNTQGEFYLTDVIGLIRGRRGLVAAMTADADEVAGVNSLKQLADVARFLREQTRERWMNEGVTIVDPDSTFIDVSVQLESDVIVQPFTFLEGETEIAAGAEIGPQARIVDSQVGPKAR
ncbi:MAG: NTP transferase domain-containing protein, partial [Actinomycetota bacterium]|nr:NTP transferase domain-containing protein [Actinomycetota bacterium]